MKQELFLSNPDFLSSDTIADAMQPPHAESPHQMQTGASLHAAAVCTRLRLWTYFVIQAHTRITQLNHLQYQVSEQAKRVEEAEKEWEQVKQELMQAQEAAERAVLVRDECEKELDILQGQVCLHTI